MPFFWLRTVRILLVKSYVLTVITIIKLASPSSSSVGLKNWFFRDNSNSMFTFLTAQPKKKKPFSRKYFAQIFSTLLNILFLLHSIPPTDRLISINICARRVTFQEYLVVATTVEQRLFSSRDVLKGETKAENE